MYDVLKGIKVVELSMWAFVPSAGAVLADWGADVVKIVPLDVSDPMRGQGVVADLPEPRIDVPFMWELMNRGKRSIGLDIANRQGYEVFSALMRQADVFTINLLPPAQRRLHVTAEEVRAINPRIIVARGSATGVRGPERELGGFDATSFWARSGIGHIASQMADEFVSLVSPAFGDVLSGFGLAAGITAALFRRERTGEGGVVDVSLLSMGMFALGPSIVGSDLYGIDTLPRTRHGDLPNPLYGAYQTKDRRYIVLGAARTDIDWATICSHLRAPELAADPRFADGAARAENRQVCIQELDKVFASRTLGEWCEIMLDYPAPWTAAKTAREMHTDPQATANGYIVDVETTAGRLPLVASPVQFDEEPAEMRRAPGHGEHTDEILAELGLNYDEILDLKIANAVL